VGKNERKNIYTNIEEQKLNKNLIKMQFKPLILNSLL